MSDNAAHARRRLCLVLGLIFAAAAAASAQQAQTVTSDRPVVCGDKSYALRLVYTEAPLKSGDGKALGVVLMPEVAADGKAFFLYWLNAQSAEPTHRDNTDGKLSGGLRAYGNGTVGTKKVAAVQDFFSGAKCSSDDPQVRAVQTLLSNSHAAPDDLRGLASALGNDGVGVKAESVEDAPADKLEVLSNLSGEEDFYKGTRQYVSDLLSRRGVTAEPTPTEIQWADERKAFLGNVEELRGQVSALKREKDSLFGAIPRWLIALFLLTSVGTLLAAAGVAREIYRHRKRSSDADDTTHDPPQTSRDEAAKASSGQASQISAGLAAIIYGARDRHIDINERYARTSQTGGGPSRRENGQGNYDLAVTILNRLKQFMYPRDYRSAGSIIEAELRKASGGAASPYERLAGELDAAYTDLQSRLEALCNALSVNEGEAHAETTPPPQVSAVTAAVVRSIEDKLDRLATDVAAVKGSVDGCDLKLGALSQLATNVDAVKTHVEGFDLKLAEYFKVNRGLQTIGTRWYGPGYAGGRADELFREVGETIDLYQLLRKRCGDEGASVAQTKDCLLNTLDNLKSIGDAYFKDSPAEAALPHRIAAKVKVKLSEDAPLVKDYRGIEESLRNHFGGEVRAAQAVTKLIEERSAAREKLGKYHLASGLTQAVDAVVATYEAIETEVKRALPEAVGALPEAAASLVSGYLALKPAAERAGELEAEVGHLREELAAASAESAASRELAGQVARRLNFKAGGSAEDPGAVTGALNLLKKEEGVHLQLRLGLSSALMALDKATGEDGSDERREVAEALLLENVKRGIRELLAGMGDYSGEQLWSRGIFLGFDDKWLHYLIRADLLLRTYYADRKEFGPLRKAVSIACSALLAALYEFQVEVVEVGLFEDLPRDMETAPVYPGVRNLPAVREKVRSKIQSAVVKEVVIDVTSFPYLVKGVQANRGCASLANPSAWVQY